MEMRRETRDGVVCDCRKEGYRLDSVSGWKSKKRGREEGIEQGSVAEERREGKWERTVHSCVSVCGG